ncbi:MAG: hypothetical protein QME75_09595 [Deltaproteobacteria bacterium]|nr:hypothetical protein [Deltaproteobacteria bacterium]
MNITDRKKDSNLPSDLFLIGTVHGDPRGYERAVRLLEYLRPDIVTVEISPFSVRYRAAHQDRWRRLFAAALAALPPEAGEHPAIRQVAARIDMPFEWLAAYAYGREYGARWQAIDLSGPAREHLPRYAGELLNPENLRQLLESDGRPLEEQAAAAYRRARLSDRQPLWRVPGRDNGMTRLRERTMAARLRKLARRGRRVAHLGGWEHVASWADGGGLYELLRDLQPQRLFLDEADKEPGLTGIWPTAAIAAGGGGATRS